MIRTRGQSPLKTPSLQTMGLVFVPLGSFLFLLGLFDGFFLPANWDGPLFWYSLTYSSSFYFGIGFVITGTTALVTARNRTRGKEKLASTEDQQLFRRIGLRNLPISVGVALIAGLISLAANTFIASTLPTDSTGIPLAIRSVIPGCVSPAPRACLSYTPFTLVLDGALWTGLAFVAVTLIDLIKTGLAHGLGKAWGHRSPKSTV